jgi:hypothetical protein
VLHPGSMAGRKAGAKPGNVAAAQREALAARERAVGERDRQANEREALADKRERKADELRCWPMSGSGRPTGGWPRRAAACGKPMSANGGSRSAGGCWARVGGPWSTRTCCGSDATLLPVGRIVFADFDGRRRYGVTTSFSSSNAIDGIGPPSENAGFTDASKSA